MFDKNVRHACRIQFLLLVTCNFILMEVKICSCTAMRCRHDHITLIGRGGNTSCLPCPRCEEGYELSVPCGNAILESGSINCQPCKKGTFSDSHEPGSCKPCTPCSKHQIVVSECTATTDTVCGKCGKGFYYENITSDCVPCSQCCKGMNDVIIEECTRSGLPKIRQCSFHRSQLCQSTCGPGMITISTPGNKGLECLECPYCPVGMGTNVPCGTALTSSNKHSIECVHCTEGKTFSDSHSSGGCKPCRSCGFGREVKKNCTSFQDTMCGGCEPGFYYDTLTESCQECSWCCNDAQDIVEAKCLTQGTPAEKRCRRNLRSVQECYRSSHHATFSSGPTSAVFKLTAGDVDTYQYLLSSLLGLITILITLSVIIFYMKIYKHFRRHKSKKDLEDFLSSDKKAKTFTPSTICSTIKQPRQVDTAVTGCQSNELEWPKSSGFCISDNTIFFEKSGVEICFPDRETYGKYRDQIALEICWNSNTQPKIPGKVVLSPVIKFHPQGLRLPKPLMVTLPHSGKLDTTGKLNEYSIEVKNAMIEDGDVAQWEEYQKGSDQKKGVKNQDRCFIIEHNQVKIEIDQLMGFVVIGGSSCTEKTFSKRMQCALFVKQCIATGKGLTIRLYVLDDCEAPFEKIMETEKEQGRELVGSLSSFDLRCRVEDEISIGVNGITQGWELEDEAPVKNISFQECLDSYQKIPQREIRFAHKVPTKKEFQCHVLLSESSGRKLAMMPVFAYCAEDPKRSTKQSFTPRTTATKEETKPKAATTVNIPPRTFTLPEKLACKPIDLPMDLREEICKHLDSVEAKDIGLGSWKHLAAKLGLSVAEITSLEMSSVGSCESPTTQLLYWMDAKFPMMKITELLQILEGIHRYDVCSLMQNWLQQEQVTTDDVII